MKNIKQLTKIIEECIANPNLIGEPNKVEFEFNKLRAQYHSRKKTSTGKEDVVQYMLDNPNTVWHWSYQLLGKSTSTGGFLSHRAPARASDLAIYHPDLVENRKIGRLMVYRLRTENMDKIKEFMNK